MDRYAQIRWLRFAPLLFAALGAPMALGIVAPNRIYGVRTAATLASEALWYRANFRAGLVLVVLGLAAAVVNQRVDRSPRLSSDGKMWTTIGSLMLIVAGMAIAGHTAG